MLDQPTLITRRAAPTRLRSWRPIPPVLAERLDQAIVIDQIVVQADDQAARVGLRGSPTLLIDGTDPFAEPGTGGQLVEPPVPSARPTRS